jgi:hypothetical protein
MKQIARWAWLSFVLVACGKAETSPGTTTATPKPETSASAEAASASATATTQAPQGAEASGTLVVAKRGVMSVEAYLGRFKLVDGDKEVRIFPSDAVPEEALEKWAGKRIRVRGAVVAPSDPNPNEAAPQGPDGKPMQRPGGVRAEKVEGL